MESNIVTLKRRFPIDTKQEWLAERKKGIGASEVPTILGLNKWTSAFTLYMRKTGQMDPPDETIPMRVGHAIEPFIAELYAEATERQVWDPGDYALVRHPDYPWLFCTVDRLAYEKGEPIEPQGRWEDNGAVELKNMSAYRAHEWKDDESPLPFSVQNQIQMACLGLKWGSVAGLIGNTTFKHFDFMRQDALIKKIIGQLEEFWDRVQNRDAPVADGSDSTAHTIFAMHPNDNNETVQISDSRVATAFRALVDTKESLKEQENWKREEENLIKNAIGDASFGEADGVKYSWKHQERKGKIVVHEKDEDKLKEAGIPYEIKGASEFRVLRKVGS